MMVYEQDSTGHICLENQTFPQRESKVSVPREQLLSAGFCWKLALSFQPLKGMWTSEKLFSGLSLDLET